MPISRNRQPWYSVGIMLSAADSLLEKGNQAKREGRLFDARGAFAEAIEISRMANDLVTVARGLERLGAMERNLGQTETALDLYRQSAGVYRELALSLDLAHTVRHEGDIALELKQFQLAASCYEEALSIYRNYPGANTLDLANTLRGYAPLQSATGEKEAAISAWQQAGILYDRVWREPGSPYTEADLAPGVAESSRQIALLSVI